MSAAQSSDKTTFHVLQTITYSQIHSYNIRSSAANKFCKKKIGNGDAEKLIFKIPNDCKMLKERGELTHLCVKCIVNVMLISVVIISLFKILIQAGCKHGMTVRSYPAIKTALVNAAKRFYLVPE